MDGTRKRRNADPHHARSLPGLESRVVARWRMALLLFQSRRWNGDLADCDEGENRRSPRIARTDTDTRRVPGPPQLFRQWAPDGVRATAHYGAVELGPLRPGARSPCQRAEGNPSQFEG